MAILYRRLEFNMKDSVLQFMINHGLSRGCMVRIDDIIKTVLIKRPYPKEIAKLIGQAVSLAVCFAASLKTKGLFSLRIDGEGAVKLLCAEINEKGDVRAYADYDKNAAYPDCSIQTMFKSGTMSFVFDMVETRERYQGMVELNKATLAECAENYFRVSEQIETVIKIASADNGKAAALFLQKMPSFGGSSLSSRDSDDIDDIWRGSVLLLGTVSDEELLDEKIAKQDLIYRLYNASEPMLLGERDIRFGCRCSREKALSACKSIPVEERANLPEVRITCEFCGQEYVVTRDELLAI